MHDFGTAFTYAMLYLSLYFEVFLLLTYLEKRNVMKDEDKRENTFYPSVSIIVPCYNEEKTVEKTLHSILALDYPKEKLEVVVVNDGSTDNTAQVLETFLSIPEMRIFHKENGGKYTALNFGLEKTSGELVGCLDADSFVEKDALKKIVAHFEEKEVMSVVPSIIVHSPSSLIQMIQRVEYEWGVFFRKMLSYVGAVYVTPGPFSIFRRSVFVDLGEYVEGHKTEDLEIALRMQKHHYKIANAHKAFVHTNAPQTLKSLYKQRLRWTYGFLKNAIDYKDLFFKKHYGQLGLLILPMATLTIFTTIYYVTLLLWRAGGEISEFITRVSTVGVSFSLQNLHFDWFFLNTDAILLLTVVVSILTVMFLLIGKYLVEGRWGVSRQLLYFLLFYPFIAPLWLSKAVYNVALSRKTNWK